MTAIGDRLDKIEAQLARVEENNRAITQLLADRRAMRGPLLDAVGDDLAAVLMVLEVTA